MDLLTILVLGIGLSMDAFAVSICKGLSLPKHTASKCLIVGTWFGVFQGITYRKKILFCPRREKPAVNCLKSGKKTDRVISMIFLR